jgi:hypothetical protein
MSNTSHEQHKFVTTSEGASVTIRDASGEDIGALERLSELDSSRLPEGPMVVAEVGHHVRAAYSLSEGRAIADPFHRTQELVALLELRAGQLNGAGKLGRGRRRSTAPQPPGFGLAFLPPRLGRRAV